MPVSKMSSTEVTPSAVTSTVLDCADGFINGASAAGTTTYFPAGSFTVKCPSASERNDATRRPSRSTSKDAANGASHGPLTGQTGRTGPGAKVPRGPD